MTTKSTTKKTTSKTKETASLNLPNNPLIFEIFNLASKQRSKAKKVEVLQKYNHDALRMLLIWNFDESIISALPEGVVPYSGYAEQTTSSGTLSTKITEEARRMYETGSFSIGTSANLPRQLFVKNISIFTTLSEVVIMDCLLFVEKRCSLIFWKDFIPLRQRFFVL